MTSDIQTVIIDVHNHFYPPEFIAAIKKGPSQFTVEEDEHGNPVLCSPGDKNFVVPGHRDIDYREGVIRDAGVDMQVITLTAPGTTMEEPKQSVYLASLVNDALAKIKAGLNHELDLSGALDFEAINQDA